jgi:hypothetical protein
VPSPTPTRRPVRPARRPAKQPSGGFGGLMRSLPFGGASAKSAPKSSGRGRKGAGIALLTAAAGYAVSNRGKIGSLLHRAKDSGSSPAPEPARTAPTATVNQPTEPPTPMDHPPE